MNKHPLTIRALRALFLALALAFALCGCTGQTAPDGDESAAPGFLLDTSGDNSITVTLDKAGDGSSGLGYLTLKEGQSVTVETQLEGSSALLLQVLPGDGTDEQSPPLPAASGEAAYLLEETVSGTNTYSFALEPGAYSVWVTSVGTSTGTANIYPGAEAAQSAGEPGLAAWQSVLDGHTGAYYAMANLAEGQDVLLLTDADSVFGDEEKCSIGAEIYCAAEGGSTQKVGEVLSGGTANPLAVANGALYYGGHKEMYKVHVDPAACTLVTDEGAQIRYNENGDAAFFKLTETGDWEEDAEGSTFDKLLEEYGGAVAVRFAPVSE